MIDVGGSFGSSRLPSAATMPVTVPATWSKPTRLAHGPDSPWQLAVTWIRPGRMADACSASTPSSVRRPGREVLEHRLLDELFDAADLREHNPVFFAERFQFVGRIPGDGAAEGFGVVGAVEDGEHLRLEAGVDIDRDDPAAVAGGVEAE